jgi:olefin beta-lactone synthetase
MKICNIGAMIDEAADVAPESLAVQVPAKNINLSFRELRTACDEIASGLLKAGLQRGDRVLLMVPFGVDFISLTFALFKAGLVPVLIDPGMGRQHMLQCIAESQPTAMIAIPLAHAVKTFRPRFFKSVRIAITVGRCWFWGGKTLDQIQKMGNSTFKVADTQAEDTAAILFTSGSTGPPKGVLYAHGAFRQQTEILKSLYNIQPGEKDLVTFPLFGLFGIGLGMTAIIPEMDFTRPAKVDPEALCALIENHNISSAFGSPALWNTVTRFCEKQNRSLKSLRRILIAGAPVPGTLLQRFAKQVDPDCQIHTPYGATESLPVASFERSEILGEAWELSQQGMGTCVGKPVAGVEVSIIKITDDPIENWSDGLKLAQGEVGEIVVKSFWTTRQYFNRETANRLAKIADGESIRHRMGDIGRIDDKGRLWFYGRKSHRVETGTQTLFTIPCETLFNQHPCVRRSALVGVGPAGKKTPIIIIEPENEMPRTANEREQQVTELLKLARRSPITQPIATVLFYPDFPVDVRHNAKIFREKLAQWAELQI